MVNITTRPASGSVEFDGSIGTKPTPAATTIGYIWASGTNNAGLWYTDGAGTTVQLNSAGGGGGGAIDGSLSDNYIPIGNATDTVGNFVLGLTENNSIWIGSDPSSVTDTASHNTAVGLNALDSVTTGDSNTIMGRNAGTAITTGEMNSYFGHAAGGEATTSSYNAFFGYNAAGTGTRGNQNVGMGYFAMSINQGTNNVAMGHNAMQGEAGADNDESVGIGAYALRNVSGTADMNTAVGYAAMQGAATGLTDAAQYNTAVGNRAMRDLTSGYANVAMGRDAGYDISSGYQNVALGYQAGYNVTTGHTNTMVGGQAARGQTTANGNTAIGYDSLYKTTIGSENVAVGKMAGYNYAGTTSALYGAFSTFLGYAAGYAVTGGNSYGHVIAIGHQPMYNATGANKSMAIGNSALVSGTDALDVVAIGTAAGAYADATGSVYIGNKAGFRTSGNYNTAVGYRALSGSSSGDVSHNNVAIGYEAMLDASNSEENVVIGNYAAAEITTGDYNVAIGHAALRYGTTTNRQVAIGYAALSNFTQDGDLRNVAVGMYSMLYPRSGSNNVAMGYGAMQGHNSVYDTDYNVALGSDTLFAIQGGNNNTAVGYQAGYAVTTGYDNTIVGTSAGATLTTGYYNTYIGKAAGSGATTAAHSNIGIGLSALSSAHGAGNVAIGRGALSSTTDANQVAIGYSALESNTAGEKNTAVGYHALTANTTGNYNTAMGHQALDSNVHGDYNTAFGYKALSAAATGDGTGGNTAIGGYMTLGSVTAGIRNNAMGHSAGHSLTTGNYNDYIGYQAGYENVHGDYNVGVGRATLEKNAPADNAGKNVGIGAFAGRGGATNTMTGSVFIGYASGYYTTGNANVAIGYGALEGGSSTYSATKNVAIGYQALKSATTAENIVAIGYLAGDAQTTDDEGSIYIGSSAGSSDYGTNRSLFIGFDAGNKNTTGQNNLAIGHKALEDMVSGIHNTAIGREAGKELTGNQNVAIGTFAMQDRVAGYYNTVIGDQAMRNSTSGDKNIILVTSAMGNDTVGTGGDENVVVGFGALRKNTGQYNVVVGSEAASVATALGNSVVIGRQAMGTAAAGTSSADNVIIGYLAGNAINGGTGRNVMIGNQAGQSATTTDSSTIIGYLAAGGSVLTGDYNTAIGYQAGYALVGAVEGNVLLGHRAGFGATSGGYNTFLGYAAGQNVTTGAGNVIIGKNAGPSSTNTDSDKLYIHNAAGTPLIGGDFSAGTVGINTSGPDRELHVHKASTSVGFKLSNDSTGQGSADGFYIDMGATDVEINNKETGKMVFATANSTRMTIDSAGEVGIGTTSPNDALDVRGNIQFSGSIYVSGSDLGGRISRVDTNEVALYAGTTEEMRLGVTNSYLKGTNWHFAGSGYMRISGTNTQLQFEDDEHYIYSDGTDLHIKTTTTASQDIALTSTGKLAVDAGDDINLDAHTGLTNFNYRGTETFRIAAGASSPVSLQPKASGFDLAMLAQDSTEVLRLDSANKRIGIGTTSPQQKLHVEGGFRFRDGNSSSQRLEGFGWNDNFALVVSGTDALALVGGTPGVRFLDQSANEHLAVTETGTNGAKITSASSMYLYGGDNLHINSADAILFEPDEADQSGGNLQFFNFRGGTEYVRFDGANQRVGIGTTAPATKLHIYSAASGFTGHALSKQIVEGNDNTYIEILTPADKYGGLIFSDGTSAEGAILYDHTNDIMHLKTDNTNRLNIASDGDVGIGTATPQYKLDVVGSTQLSGAASISSTLTVTGATLAVQKTIKNDVTGAFTISDSYSHYYATADGQDPGLATCTITMPTSHSVGDEYTIVANCVSAPSFAGGTPGVVKIKAGTGGDINGAGTGLITLNTSNSDTVPNYKVARILCVSTNLWILDLSSQCPTS